MSAVSVLAPIELRAPKDVNTIPFKNVLDALEAFETPSDDHASGEQPANSEGTTSKFNGASAGKTVPDPMSGQPPHGAPQVAIANVAVVNQDSVQLAAVPAAMAAPTAAAGPTQKTAESQQNSTAPDAVVPTSTEPPARDNDERETAVRGSLDSTRTETARALGVESSTWRSSDPIPAPATARFSASVQFPNAPVNSAPVKSTATEVQIIAAPAPAVSAVSSVSTSKTPAPATPVVTRSEGKSRAETGLEQRRNQS